MRCVFMKKKTLLFSLVTLCLLSCNTTNDISTSSSNLDSTKISINIINPNFSSEKEVVSSEGNSNSSNKTSTDNPTPSSSESISSEEVVISSESVSSSSNSNSNISLNPTLFQLEFRH